MASVAIDSNDIRSSEASRPDTVRPRRATWMLGTAGAVAVLAGGAWIARGYVPAFPQLGGLSSIVEPPRPARKDIRIGAFPPMPEIVDGVPALVEPRPVRVVGTAPASPASTGPTAAAPIVATSGVAALPARPTGVAPSRGASLLSPSLTAPASMAAVEPVRRIDEPGATLGLLRPTTPSKPAPPSVAESRPVPGTRPEVVAAAAAPVSLAAKPAGPVEPAALRSEPGETAALSPAPTRAPMASPAIESVPLPPPAPPRLARSPDVEKSASPLRPAARPRPAAVASGEAPAAAPVPAEAPPDERMEVLGMKLPNGRDIGNALSALGDSVKNLPKSF